MADTSSKDALKDLLRTFGIFNVVRWVYLRSIYGFWRVWGALTARNLRICKARQADGQTAKLHLGCGNNYLDGWVNTDIYPNKNRIYLDLTKKFELESDCFGYAFCEHVIEHIPYNSGKNLINETFRVLKSGGVFRLVTPDINFLIDMYKKPETDIHKRYVKWNAEEFIGDAAPHTALTVFNNYVRDWGHVYIYDFPSLEAELKAAGFTDIKIEKICKSQHDALQNLEHEIRQPEGLLELESLIIEATKP